MERILIDQPDPGWSESAHGVARILIDQPDPGWSESAQQPADAGFSQAPMHHITTTQKPL